MTDFKGNPWGSTGKPDTRYHDDGDGTYDEAGAAHLRGWDTTDLSWNRLPVDHATGALKVAATVTGGGGGGPATVADGADVAEGATTDSAVTTDTSGTVSGKLRGLVKWAYERMPASLGQKTKANSFPVVLSSDQDALAVTGPLTDTQLRATPVPVSGSITTTGPLTDTQLRATPVPVSGTVTASGPVTDTQIRATPLPVSGTVTASGPLTDTQLRATDVGVSVNTERATAASAGTLPALLKVIGGYDSLLGVVTPMPVATVNGFAQGLVYDSRNRAAINEMRLVLEEIRDLLKESKA